MILSIFSNKAFFKHNAIAQLDPVQCEPNFNIHWEAKILCDSLYCDIHFIMAVWNWTHNISKVSLYFKTAFRAFLLTKLFCKAPCYEDFKQNLIYDLGKISKSNGRGAHWTPKSSALVFLCKWIPMALKIKTIIESYLFTLRVLKHNKRDSTVAKSQALFNVSCHLLKIIWLWPMDYEVFPTGGEKLYQVP